MIDIHNIFCLTGSQAIDTLTRPTITKPRRAELITTIPIRGVLSSRATYWREVAHTPTITQQVKDAAADPEVGAILLDISSPGGSVTGIVELADTVAAATQRKPVWASISDIGASAAYFIASQAKVIYAGRGALVGGIGTFTVIWDTSKLAQKMGITVHVVRAGEYKAIGEAGVPVTERDLKEIQRVIDGINDQFLSAVRRGRKLTATQFVQSKTGQVWLAAEAMAKGLVDHVGTFDDALAALAGELVRTDREAYQRFNDMLRTASKYDRANIKARYPKLAARAAAYQNKYPSLARSEALTPAR